MDKQLNELSIIVKEKLIDLGQNELFWLVLTAIILIILIGNEQMRKVGLGKGIMGAIKELILYISALIVDIIDAVKSAISFKDGIRTLLFGHFSESAQFVMMNYAITFLSATSFLMVTGGLDNVIDTVSAIFMAFGLQTAFLLFSSRLVRYFFPRYARARRITRYYQTEKIPDRKISNTGKVDSDNFASAYKTVYINSGDKDGTNEQLKEIAKIGKIVIMSFAVIVTGLILSFFSAVYLCEQRIARETAADREYGVVRFLEKDQQHYKEKLELYYENTKDFLNDFLYEARDICKKAEEEDLSSRATDIINELANGKADFEAEEFAENFKLFLDDIHVYDQNSDILFGETGYDLNDLKIAVDNYLIMRGYFASENEDPLDNIQNFLDSTADSSGENAEGEAKQYAELIYHYLEKMEIFSSIRDVNPDKISGYPNFHESSYRNYLGALNWLKIIDQEVSDQERSFEEVWYLIADRMHFYDYPKTVMSIVMGVIMEGFILVLCFLRGHLRPAEKALKKRNVIAAAFLNQYIDIASEQRDSHWNVVICITAAVAIAGGMVIRYIGQPLMTYLLFMTVILFLMSALHYWISSARLKKMVNNGNFKKEEEEKKNRNCLESLLKTDAETMLSRVEAMPLFRKILLVEKADDYYQRKIFYEQEKEKFKKDYRYRIKPYIPHNLEKLITVSAEMVNGLVIDSSLIPSKMKAEIGFLMEAELVFPLLDEIDQCTKFYVLSHEFYDLLLEVLMDRAFNTDNMEATFEQEVLLYEDNEDRY